MRRCEYPDLVMKIGCEYRFCLLADLRVLPWLLAFVFACFGFFGMRDLFERESLRGLIAFSLLPVNDPSETVSKQLFKK